MKRQWRDFTLGDLFHIKHGFAFKGEYFTDEGAFILLTPGNFKESGGLQHKGEKEKYYSGEIPQDYVLERGDLLVAMTDLTQNAPILGSPAFIPSNGKYLHNQRLGKVIDLKRDRVAASFLFYLFNSASVRGQIKGSASGATVRHTSPSRIYEVKVRIPDITTQRKIAGILSAHDDLIENNTRRIAILEEMAQKLYKEWFVNFRFPGHENAKFVDSPLGKIPEGWKATTVKEITNYINRGVSPKYDEGFASLVINQKCIRDGAIDLTKSRTHRTVVPTEKYLRFGDILVNSTGRGTLGRVAQVYAEFKDCTVDSHVTIVRPSNTFSIDYLGFAIGKLEQFFDHRGTGSTGQTELPRSVIGETSILFPAHNIQKQFSLMVQHFRNQKEVLRKKNECLRKSRDLLLPKLISGQLDVEDLDIDTGEPLVESST